MPVFSKIWICITLNLLGWLYLIIQLKRVGNSFGNTFKLAWLWIIGTQQLTLDAEYQSFFWVSLLQKCWWISILVFCIFSLESKDVTNVYILVGIFGFHFLWYLLSLINVKTKFDKTFRIHSNWGIFFQEVNSKSVLLEKSLAELDLRKKNLLVLSIDRNGQVISFPKGLETIQVGDRLVIFGEINSYRTILN